MTDLRRILVYEYTCSGGLLSGEPANEAGSLLREGWAMLAALATDLAAIPGVQVQVLADHRGLPGPLAECELIVVRNPIEQRALFTQLAAGADWTITIAPETGGALHERCQWVEKCGGRLLGATSSLIGLLGDKHRTAEYLTAHGVPCPVGTHWRPRGSDVCLSSPFVVKPLDGAGSQQTYLVDHQNALDELLANLSNRTDQPRGWRVETFQPGMAVSVSALCGPAGWRLLPPCRQRIRFDKTISYHGGAFPIAPPLTTRAENLAHRTLKTLPSPFGYLGIDMVLGADGHGRDDFVIEINPRLTTSYVGLRVASQTNLAKAMLDIAAGETPDLSFDQTPFEFDADGTVRRFELH